MTLGKPLHLFKPQLLGPGRQGEITPERLLKKEVNQTH